MQDISHVVVPIHDHAFFEKPQLQSLFCYNFFQIAGFTAQVFDLGRCRGTCRVTCRPLFTCLLELFGPAVVKALCNAFTATQLRNAVLALEAVQHDPDRLFCGVLFAPLSSILRMDCWAAVHTANVLYDLIPVALFGSRFLSHLRSLVVTMGQKPSLIKST